MSNTIHPATQFGVNNTPWASEGRKVSDAKTMQEAMEIAGLDFTVETTRVHVRNKGLTDEMVEDALLANPPQTISDYTAVMNTLMNECYADVPSHNVIRRQDTHDVFGVVGNRWEPLQNSHAFDWFQPALDDGLIKLDTVGKLNKGKKIWILAELDEPPVEIVPGDTVAKYIILGNGHDGGTAIFVGFTPIRVWCANQFPQLRKSAKTEMIRLRHTSNAKIQLDRIRNMINYANAEFNATAEQYRELCRHTCNAADLEKYVKVILLPEKEHNTKLCDLSTKSRNKIESVIDLAYTGIGLQSPQIKDTWYAAFNAVNQHLNYESGRNANNRLNSLWFGQNKNVNDKALRTALAMAN